MFVHPFLAVTVVQDFGHKSFSAADVTTPTRTASNTVAVPQLVIPASNRQSGTRESAGPTETLGPATISQPNIKFSPGGTDGARAATTTLDLAGCGQPHGADQRAGSGNSGDASRAGEGEGETRRDTAVDGRGFADGAALTPAQAGALLDALGGLCAAAEQGL